MLIRNRDRIGKTGHVKNSKLFRKVKLFNVYPRRLEYLKKNTELTKAWSNQIVEAFVISTSPVNT